MKIRVLDKELYSEELRYGFGPAREGDAGLDLRIREDVLVVQGKTLVVPLGVAIELPPCTVGLMTGRSSLTGQGMLSLEGKIDAGYRGEIHAQLTPLSGAVELKRGERVAQLIVIDIHEPNWQVVDELSNSSRGDNRFGSTGRS
jgi:dUTP pyrophosphatase